LGLSGELEWHHNNDALIIREFETQKLVEKETQRRINLINNMIRVQLTTILISVGAFLFYLSSILKRTPSRQKPLAKQK
jgi:hypothetical protein